MSSKSQTRLAAVAGATIAATAVWIVATLVGVEVEAPMGDKVQDVSVVAVVITSLLSSLVGWGLLAVLEKLTGKGRPIWIGIAVVVFLLSLVGPLTAAGISGGAKLTLVLMHVAVAAVLIPMLGRASAARVAVS